MKKTIQKNIFHIILLLSLTAFALWFALKDDYREVLFHIAQVSKRWLLLIVLLGILYYVLQGIAITIIARPYKKAVRISDGVHNAYIAAFFNGVTPLGGGQVAQTYAFRKLGLSYTNIASILWKDFFLYQSTVLIYVVVLLIACFSFAMNSFHAYFFLVLIGFSINASVILILWTMAKCPKLYMKISGVLTHILAKLHIVKQEAHTLEKWQGQILYFNEEIKKLKEDKKMIVKVVCLNIVRQTIFYALPFGIALALGIPMQFTELIDVMVMSSFIHMLNALTPLPGDTGWTETAFILIFATMFGRLEASSVMILWRVATYHINILIGGSIFLYVKTKQKRPPNDDIKTQRVSEQTDQCVKPKQANYNYEQL